MSLLDRVQRLEQNQEEDRRIESNRFEALGERITALEEAVGLKIPGAIAVAGTQGPGMEEALRRTVAGPQPWPLDLEQRLAVVERKLQEGNLAKLSVGIVRPKLQEELKPPRSSRPKR